MNIVYSDECQNPRTTHNVYVQRGDVFMVDFGQRSKRGSVQEGMRPAVVVTNSKGCRYSPTLHVVPLTSANKRSMPMHVYINADKTQLEMDSIALVEQTAVVNKDDLFKKITSLCSDIMNQIDDRLHLVFELK